MDMIEFINNAPDNPEIWSAFAKAQQHLAACRKASCSISGGSDSDVMLDIITKADEDHKVEYVFYNTGVEFQATKDHLKFLEQKYNIKINEVKAVKPIPTCVREYGVPFLSKYVSEMISRLQRNGFKFEDKPYEELIKEYPNCMSGVKWWCNCQDSEKLVEKNLGGRFNISRNKWLKEFMIANPPTFKIDNKCCYYAKKLPAKKFIKENGADLNIFGVRKAEGGIRAGAYESCFSPANCGTVAAFRPLFWFSDSDKQEYEKAFNVTHSDCYTKYGFKRTGCVGCPYSRNLFDDLTAIQMYEPKLYKACMKIFGQSYEYTKKYRQFCAEMKDKEKYDPDQLSLFDMFYDFNTDEETLEEAGVI